MPIVKYEDFVAAPAIAMQRACAILELPFTDHFSDLFSVFQISGDSGGAGATNEARPRRPTVAALCDEAHRSGHYRRLASRLSDGQHPSEQTA